MDFIVKKKYDLTHDIPTVKQDFFLFFIFF